MLNIGQNAVKYTLEGSIMIKISTMLLGTQEHIQCKIKDTGVGMGENAMGNILNILGVGGSRPMETGGEMGIGLSLCKVLATKLGGDLSIESKLDSGSLFTLWFPANLDLHEDLGDIIGAKRESGVSKWSNTSTSIQNIPAEEDVIIYIYIYIYNTSIGSKCIISFNSY